MDNTSEQNEHENALTRLKPVHQEAVKLRLKGMQYTFIAETLVMEGYKVKEHTIRTWFMKGGICYQFFTSIRRQRHETIQERLEYTKFLLQEAALDAVMVLRAAIEGENISWRQIRAAQDLLDRAGFPKFAPIRIQATISTNSNSSELAEKIRAIAARTRDSVVISR